MAKLLHGERIARTGRISLGCCAVIFDPLRQKVLLTRRADNGRWCLPGGRVEPGERVAETCIREVQEETGLHIQIVRLIGVYSDPDILLEYADGERCHVIALSFEAKVVGGALCCTDEVTGYGYFSRQEIQQLDVMENHLERITDAFAGSEASFTR